MNFFKSSLFFYLIGALLLLSVDWDTVRHRRNLWEEKISKDQQQSVQQQNSPH